MKMILQAVLVAAVVALGLTAKYLLVGARDEVVIEGREERAALVEVITTEFEPVELEVELFGNVEPAREARVSSQVAGRVARIASQAIEGGRVEAGTVLVELDTADLELALVAARARVAEAEAKLVLEEAEADMARMDLERGGVTEPGPLALREPQLAGARAALESARAGVDRATLDLERATIRAPFDALVTAELVERGQVVAPGTPLFQLVATDVFEIRLPLVDRDRALLDPLGTGAIDGPAVELSVAAGHGSPVTVYWQGTITRTLPALDPESRALVAIAEVRAPLDTSPPLRLGQFVRARIAGRTLDDAVILPEAAVRANDVVWLADEQDRLVPTRVRVAKRMADQVVVESGLAADMRVIVSSLDAAPEGLTLEVRQHENETEERTEQRP